MYDNYQEHTTGSTQWDREPTFRGTKQVQQHLARQKKQLHEHIAKEIRQNRERIEKKVREERERIARAIKKERERRAKEIARERERIDRERRERRERFGREIKPERDWVLRPAVSLSKPHLITPRRPVLVKQKMYDFYVSDSDESDDLDNDQHSDSPDMYGSPLSMVPSCCPYLLLAREFVSCLRWPSAIFNSKFDRCYCHSCYESRWSDVLQAGGAPYVIPRGWVRLGVLVDPVVEQVQDIWNRWHVTYHGTSEEAAISILKQRQFSIPGDQLLGGNFLSIRPGHIPGKQYIYTSPTIAYSSLSVYCPSYGFTSKQNQRYRVKIVLGCRQNPQLMQIQGETVGKERERICPFIPNSRIEYFTEARASLVVYGLLLNFEERHSDIIWA